MVDERGNLVRINEKGAAGRIDRTAPENTLSKEDLSVFLLDHYLDLLLQKIDCLK